MASQPPFDEQEAPRFPWRRAALMLVAAWLSIWAAGYAGGRAGEYVYDDKYVPEPPYTEQELASLERVSPQTFKIAEMDMAAWSNTVEMGRTLARLEGRVVGSLVLLAIWASVGLVWLWNRQRARQAGLGFSGDFSHQA